MTTETKKNDRFTQFKRFAANTMRGTRVSVARRSITKSVVAVGSAVKSGAKMVWEWAIKPAFTFIQRWFGPLLSGVVQGYIVLCVATITSVLVSPVPGGRYAGTPIFWAMLRSGFGFRY